MMTTLDKLRGGDLRSIGRSHKSKIVRVSALEALTDLAQRNKSIIKEVTKTVRFHAETGSPAVQARGRKLLKRSQSP